MENYEDDTGPIQTGDTVRYEGSVYFVRKNGTTCYLYKTEEDLRQKRNKVLTPSIRSVQKVMKKKSPTTVNYSYYQSSPFLNRKEESESMSGTMSSEGYGTGLTLEEENQLWLLLSKLTLEDKKRILQRDSQITGSW